VNLAAPRTRLATARVDKILEALEIAANLRRDNANPIAGLFCRRVGFPTHIQRYARFAIGRFVETNFAFISHAGRAAPRDQLIWDLPKDFGVPFFFFSADLRSPMQAFIVKLPHLSHPFHDVSQRWQFIIRDSSACLRLCCVFSIGELLVKDNALLELNRG
jgi:hypothetical protein